MKKIICLLLIVTYSLSLGPTFDEVQDEIKEMMESPLVNVMLVYDSASESINHNI
jgi:hypothetical protein